MSRALNANPPFHAEQPVALPVCRFLARALSRGQQPPARMVRSVEAIAPLWPGATAMTGCRAALADKYAYAEIMGPAGPGRLG